MSEFFILGFFFIVVGIPVIAGVGGGIYKRKLKLQEKQLELQSTMTAEKAAQYAAHTERLEQRMRVLERILTDKGTDLAAEIEDLRDRPLN
jgi:ABC-type phosphate transport system auxiliary subunit